MAYAELPGVQLWYTNTGGDGVPVIFCTRLQEQVRAGSGNHLLSLRRDITASAKTAAAGIVRRRSRALMMKAI